MTSLTKPDRVEHCGTLASIVNDCGLTRLTPGETIKGLETLDIHQIKEVGKPNISSFDSKLSCRTRSKAFDVPG